jgi:hypothetical protein
MGRLEDIATRNRTRRWPRERFAVMFGLGIFLLLILALMVFTDLGRRPEPTGERRVNDVLLRAPRGDAGPTPRADQP